MLRLTTCIIAIFIAAACFGAPATIVTGEHPSNLESLAAKELQKYVYAASGDLLPIAIQSKGDVIAVGTPASNPLVRKLKPNLAGLGDQGYMLGTVRDGRRTVLLVTGNTPISVLYGAYSLLEEYGLGFYLGGDTIPAKKPFKLLSLNVSRKPALKIRGTLPWYNFFDSPTTWDFEDYAWFFDQLVKTKNNFIGFHSYDNEPFAAYIENGKFIWGEPLQSTANPCWGTTPMKTSEFGGNTAKYYATEYFGAGPSLYRDQRERSIQDAQTLLKRALDYGKSRGLKVCVGFEVNGNNPAGADDLKRLEDRLRHLVAAYPMLDYVWLWENEGRAIWPPEPPPLDSEMGAYYRRLEKHFAYLNNPGKIAEGVRLAVYTIEADRILKEIAPRMKLVLSGWGGDNHLHVSDFYPGLDKVVPKDVIFSALDNIVVSDTVSEAYGKLSPDRERWPIPWFEYDGDQWFPQPNAKTWGNACRDALSKGSQGVLGIHWRTRDVEESHAYMSQFAWQPALTYEGFYARYAKRCFGEKYAREMASILMELQSLGYRWRGGGGQPECGGFTWGSPTDPAKTEKLESLLSRLRAVYDDLAARPGFERQAERVAYFIATAEWALRYDQTAAQLRNGGEVRQLLDQARKLKQEGDLIQASGLASQALSKLHACRFDLALDTLASRLTNKGEMGILATVNAKAYADYRTVERALREIAGTDAGPSTLDPGPSTIDHGPIISPINPNTLWTAGTQMPIKVVAQGDGFTMRAVWRKAGDSRTQTIALNKAAPRYFEGSILCPIGGFEYAVELLNSNKVIHRWPGRNLWHQVAVISPVPPSAYQSPLKGKSPTASNLRVRPGDGIALVMEWSGTGSAYEISRSVENGPFEPLRTIRDTWLEDRAVEPGKSYRYSVVPISRGIRGKSVVSRVLSPTALRLTPPPVTAIAYPGKVRLRWPKAPIGVAAYSVYRSASTGGPWESLTPDGPKQAENWRDNVFAAVAQPDAPMYYKVAALNRAGAELAASEPVICAALPGSPLQPILSLDLATGLSGGNLNGAAVIEKVNDLPVLHFTNGGYLAFPHRPELNTDQEITVSLWVKLVSLGNMPVVLSHGQFDVDGYFVQVFGGRIRFYLHGVGLVDAGGIQPGKWYHIAGTYDGSEIAVYLNGERVGRAYANGQITPCGRTLYVGRYEHAGPEYETESLITGVRIYPTGLPGDEVRKEYLRLAAPLR